MTGTPRFLVALNPITNRTFVVWYVMAEGPSKPTAPSTKERDLRFQQQLTKWDVGDCQT